MTLPRGFESKYRVSEGLTIDHLCGVKRCVNPDHMEVVTRGENTRRYYRQGAYRRAA